MKNLKKLRIDYGLSQQALANHFNLSQQTIYKYENELAEPDIEMLKNFSQFFGVTIDYLVDNSNSDSNADISFSPTTSEIDLIKKIRLLNPTVRQSLIELIKNL